MVGYTANDINAAHKAGIKAIAVNYGYSRVDELASAEIIIRTLEDLIEDE